MANMAQGAKIALPLILANILVIMGSEYLREAGAPAVLLDAVLIFFGALQMRFLAKRGTS